MRLKEATNRERMKKKGIKILLLPSVFIVIRNKRLRPKRTKKVYRNVPASYIARGLPGSAVIIGMLFEII